VYWVLLLVCGGGGGVSFFGCSKYVFCCKTGFTQFSVNSPGILFFLVNGQGNSFATV
jgi:hypothetical protein